MSVFGVILVSIFPHSDWIRTRITPNTDNFYSVIQFYRQFLIINFGFWLVNILLQKIEDFSKKWNENDKNIYDEKQQNNKKKPNSELAPRSRDVIQSNFREPEKIKLIRNCQRNTILTILIRHNLYNFGDSGNHRVCTKCFLSLYFWWAFNKLYSVLRLLYKDL